MLGTRSRALVAGSALGALLVTVLAAPALADDPPEPDWQLVSSVTTPDGVTVTWEVADSTNAWPGETATLDPVPIYRPNIVNNSGESRLFGFGTDFATQGVMDYLWTEEAWGAFGADFFDAGLGYLSGAELADGESYVGNDEVWARGMPAWSGHTVTIYALEPTGVDGEDPIPTALASISTPGRFVPIDLSDGDLNNISAVLGQRAMVQGVAGAPVLLAGVAATVVASGLPAGQTFELWIAKDMNYAYFQILGGGLPVGATKVGTGTVAANGTLSTGFALPSDLEPGDYQLVIGNRAERYWPAGSYDDFQVSEPPPGLILEEVRPVAGPGGESVGFQWPTTPLGEIVVGVSYAEGSSAGTTSALYSATGPLPVGFTLATDPPLYVHVNTSVALNGPAQVCVNYDPAVVTGDPPHLFHFDTSLGEWVDITDPGEVGAGYACGFTTSFSPFVLGYPDAVTFSFSGFFDPVSMDAENIAKAGQAIPVKFSLGGNQGLDVMTSAKFFVEGPASSYVGDPVDAATAGKSGLSYDAKKDQYTYVWKTDKSFAGKQGRFELKLSDGTTHSFDVTFKK